MTVAVVLARQSQAVVEESHQLAEHDAQSRQELLAAQDRMNTRLDQHRSAIDAGRDQLEAERRELADQRGRAPIIAASIQNVVLLAACLLPLVICLLVPRQMYRSVQPDEKDRNSRLAQGRDHRYDQRFRGRVLPGSEQVHRAGAGPTHRRDPYRRIPSERAAAAESVRAAVADSPIGRWEVIPADVWGSENHL